MSSRSDTHNSHMAVEPVELWDVIQGRADDEQQYTTLRHATLGLAVELWHDSMGAFHLYLPHTVENAAKAPGAVLCCFSSGIVVMEDSVCAPELLLELCANTSFLDDTSGLSFWSRDPNFCLPRSGLQICDSSGDRSWEICPEGSSRLIEGREATNAIVISHALTNSEIVLFNGGLIFLGGEPFLLSSVSTTVPSELGLGDTSADVNMQLQAYMLRGKHAPSDPVHLRGTAMAEGFSWNSSWHSSNVCQPSIDATIRQRIARDKWTPESGRRTQNRHFSQQPNAPQIQPPRFCGSFSKWGAHSGLVNVSLQHPEEAIRVLPGLGAACFTVQK
jgi:hypothetical protein